MQKTFHNFIRFFLACVYLSALTIGGGYVIVPLMQKSFVEKYGWLEEEEMLSLVAIAQSAPGAIALNTANLVGWKLLGFWGAVVGVVGTILPPMIIILILSAFYLQFRDHPIVSAVLAGMTAGVAALILDAVCTMIGKLIGNRKLLPPVVCAVAFFIAFFTGVNIVWILICSAVFGGLIGLRKDSKGGGLL
jgi:chromate transporter